MFCISCMTHISIKIILLTIFQCVSLMSTSQCSLSRLYLSKTKSKDSFDLFTADKELLCPLSYTDDKDAVLLYFTHLTDVEAHCISAMFVIHLIFQQYQTVCTIRKFVISSNPCLHPPMCSACFFKQEMFVFETLELNTCSFLLLLCLYSLGICH